MRYPSSISKARALLAITFFLISDVSVRADYAVTLQGAWPKDWPETLEPLRSQAQSFEGPFLPSMHHGISFSKRKTFEAAWPAILSLKSEGAPIILRKGKNFWLRDNAIAGVCIHTPPEEPRFRSSEPSDSLKDSIYIELIVDGKIVDLNRIRLPEKTPIIDQRFSADEKTAKTAPESAAASDDDLPGSTQ